MKGQRLFIRPFSAADLGEVARFYSIESHPGVTLCTPTENSLGLIGRLVGDLVAHLSYRDTGEGFVIESIYVARLLRRKQVGRFMVGELEKLAAVSGRNTISAARDDGSEAFFRAIGFAGRQEAPTLTKTITPGGKH